MVLVNTLMSAVPLIPLYLAVYLLFLMRSDFDLTIAGSFGVAGAVTAETLVDHWPVALAMATSVVVGGVLGLVTAVLHSAFRIPVFLAGLIMSTGLLTVTIRVMHKQATVNLLDVHSITAPADSLTGNSYYYTVVGICAVIVFAALALVGYFLRTEIGLALRAAGLNPRMARSNGFNDKIGVTLALVLGNALSALSGSLLVQVQKYAVSSNAQFEVIGGLSAVVIGSFIVRPSSSRVLRMLAAVVVGGLIYQAILAIALDLGVDSVDFNLVTAATLTAAICLQVQFRRLFGAMRGRQVDQEDRIGAMQMKGHDLERALVGKD